MNVTIDHIIEDPDVEEGADTIRSGSLATDIAIRLIEASLPRDAYESLAAGKALAVVVDAPTAAWVGSIEDGFDILFDGVKILTLSRDGSNKRGHVPTDGNERVAKTLRHHAVIGISHAPERHLPSTLVTVCDARVRLEFGKGRILHDLLQAETVAPIPDDVSDALLRGLEPLDIEAAFRAGSTGLEVVERLKAAKTSKLPKVMDTDAPLVADLHGYGAAKDWALDLVDRVDRWKAGKLPWSRVAASAVLAGPPGVGKTLFGRSLAATLEVPLVATSVGSWFATSEGHLGDVVKAITRAFESARAQSPCVLLIDEMDAIPSRDDLSRNGRDWWTPVVTHLLTLLDGAVTDREGIVVVGTTNHPDRLDPALMRSGRLETLIAIGYPTTKDLAAILRLRGGDDLRDIDDADLVTLMEATLKATGADVVRWLREARRRARERGAALALEDLTAVVLPEETRSDGDLEIVSVHEAGHAVIGHVLGVGVRRVSIIASDSFGGMTDIGEHLTRCPTVEDCENLAVSFLAGRIAEREVTGRLSVGSAADLEMATRLVGTLHVSFGMGRSLVHRGSPSDVDRVITLDPEIRRDVDEHLRRLEMRTIEVVRHNREKIVGLAGELRKRRLLSGNVLGQWLDGTVPSEGDVARPRKP